MPSVIDSPAIAQHNGARTLFRDILCHFQLDPCSTYTEVAAANLAAYLASSKGCCVGIVKSNELQYYHGILFMLGEYGVVGRTRPLAKHNAYVVFLQVELDDSPSEFEGATVKARYVRRAVAA